MTTLSDGHKKVPMMFRAQVNGRSQLQRIQDLRYSDVDEQDAERWVDEWIIKAYPDSPTFSDEVQTRIYDLSWRFVTNGGQDDGIIRPVVGAKGWPFYPGSSMKGLFRDACDRAQADRYCGQELSSKDFRPGILRFHGGYPTDGHWTDQLLDIIHPQQDNQVKENQRSKAFFQVSLYKPELKFGISSTEALDASEWDTIWSIWERAIAAGLGCRVSAGYGQLNKVTTGQILYQTRLKGQGQAAKLIDGTGEFRPNVFRASIRGHALRIFGGLTDGDTADRIVEQLFGGITRGAGQVGLLGMAFTEESLELDEFGQRSYRQPVYRVKGLLTWRLTQTLSETQKAALTKLIRALSRFAMMLGGFGKSWRRADHRLVYPDYYDDSNKPLIGCHWEWLGARAQTFDTRAHQLEQVGTYIDQVRQAAREWMTLQGHTPKNKPAVWRESWHPSNAQVWGRLAQEKEDSEAVHWLHGPYRRADRTAGIREGSIYQSALTGQMNQVGRLWHRMYPWIRLKKDPNDPKKRIPVPRSECFELLTIFPGNLPEARDFLYFLENQQTQFKKLWPISSRETKT